MLARHTLEREYPEQVNPKPLAPLQPQLLGMLLEAAARFSKLVTHWLRVGYVQSNFNSDNCLVGGRTMDYGPFGFVERFVGKSRPSRARTHTATQREMHTHALAHSLTRSLTPLTPLTPLTHSTLSTHSTHISLKCPHLSPFQFPFVFHDSSSGTIPTGACGSARETTSPL